MTRVFIAVDLPEEFQDRIREIQSGFEGFRVRPVRSDHVHITLKFLGDVKEPHMSDIANALDNIGGEPFDARIAGVGAFPGSSRARVVWLGAEGKFGALHDRVESALSLFNFKNDRHDYIPHATLARVKHMPVDQKDEFKAVLDGLKDAHVGTMRVDRIQLKKSTLTPEGPIYETLHEAMI
ncbi:MAG: RNA 2',3'-cyclic phosphodiesterase [Methanosarcinaceae archaeon]|nr:RNA 2',3'-cyclic phosphodiesterase [Methanosarcinaceae archaeon]